MSEYDGVVIISKDTAIKGSIRNCKRLEVSGYVEGDVTTTALIVHEGGVFHGQAKTGSAEVSGLLQGDIVVDGLMKIHSIGTVNGNVHYGRLSMDAGAHLIAVVRGRSARITTADITAFDPDDTAANLAFSVSNEQHGMVTVTGAGKGRAQAFTQADLTSGRVLFQHDGSATPRASFDVVVTDHAGGTSGAPQTVTVTVRAAA
jgi:cytoskeletal protein CcmA (bactofilin family)